MMNWVGFLGLTGYWLSVAVALLFIPSLYLFFSLDVHKEYGDIVRSAIEKGYVKSKKEKDNLLKEVDEKVAFFKLEWWIIAAFGVLMIIIIAGGEMIADLSAPSDQKGECFSVASGGTTSETSHNRQIHNGIIVYANAVGFFIGFRIAWERLKLAREARELYVRVSFTPAEKAEEMPPSGYSEKQADSVSDLLRSCADALQIEAAQKGRDLKTAIEYEIVGIQRHLAQTNVTEGQGAILRLTLAFYTELKKADVTNHRAYWSEVEKISKDMRADMLSIKVS